jgi:hypothetical protein
LVDKLVVFAEKTPQITEIPNQLARPSPPSSQYSPPAGRPESERHGRADHRLQYKKYDSVHIYTDIPKIVTPKNSHRSSKTSIEISRPSQIHQASLPNCSLKGNALDVGLFVLALVGLLVVDALGGELALAVAICTTLGSGALPPFNLVNAVVLGVMGFKPPKPGVLGVLGRFKKTALLSISNSLSRPLNSLPLSM